MPSGVSCNKECIYGIPQLTAKGIDIEGEDPDGWSTTLQGARERYIIGDDEEEEIPDAVEGLNLTEPQVKILKHQEGKEPAGAAGGDPPINNNSNTSSAGEAEAPSDPKGDTGHQTANMSDVLKAIHQQGKIFAEQMKIIKARIDKYEVDNFDKRASAKAIGRPSLVPTPFQQVPTAMTLTGAEDLVNSRWELVTPSGRKVHIPIYHEQDIPVKFSGKAQAANATLVKEYGTAMGIMASAISKDIIDALRASSQFEDILIAGRPDVMFKLLESEYMNNGLGLVEGAVAGFDRVTILSELMNLQQGNTKLEMHIKAYKELINILRELGENIVTSSTSSKQYSCIFMRSLDSRRYHVQMTTTGMSLQDYSLDDTWTLVREWDRHITNNQRIFQIDNTRGRQNQLVNARSSYGHDDDEYNYDVYDNDELLDEDIGNQSDNSQEPTEVMSHVSRTKRRMGSGQRSGGGAASGTWGNAPQQQQMTRYPPRSNGDNNTFRGDRNARQKYCINCHRTGHVYTECRRPSSNMERYDFGIRESRYMPRANHRQQAAYSRENKRNSSQPQGQFSGDSDYAGHN